VRTVDTGSAEVRRTDDDWALRAMWARSASTGRGEDHHLLDGRPRHGGHVLRGLAGTDPGLDVARTQCALHLLVHSLVHLSLRMPGVGVADVVPVADLRLFLDATSVAQDLVDPGDGTAYSTPLPSTSTSCVPPPVSLTGVRSRICSEPPSGSPRPA
jgi:hypothetical protein